MVSEDDEPVALDAALFLEPEGYYEPEKPQTYAEHTLLSGEVLKLRLVGHNPLWVKITLPGQASETSQAKRIKGHLLWNAGRVVSGYLEENVDRLVKEKDVLELGAGAGLPSLVCAARGARTVSRDLSYVEGTGGIRC